MMLEQILRTEIRLWIVKPVVGEGATTIVWGRLQCCTSMPGVVLNEDVQATEKLYEAHELASSYMQYTIHAL